MDYRLKQILKTLDPERANAFLMISAFNLNLNQFEEAETYEKKSIRVYIKLANTDDSAYLEEQLNGTEAGLLEIISISP